MSDNMKVTALAPWFGSKRTLAPAIVKQLGPHRAFVDPFCGSMCVLLAKPGCSFEMVNDLHGDVINLSWVIRHEREGPRLYRRLRRTYLSEDDFRTAKVEIDSWPVAPSPAEVSGEHAQRAYYYFVLCWMGRSGMLGTKGTNNNFTVRYTCNGGNQAIRFHAAVESIPAWRKRLRSVTILRRDGFELLQRLADEKGQVVYCDPPYLHKGAQYEHDFGPILVWVCKCGREVEQWESRNDPLPGCMKCRSFELKRRTDQHERLSELLGRFVNTRVVLSYYAHPKLDALYPGWTQIDCSRAKHLAVQGRRGGKGTTAPELLLVNGPAFDVPQGEASSLFLDASEEVNA